MADSSQPASSDDGPNPFADRLAADPGLGQVSLAERARLNANEAFYRGTLTGAGGLASAEANARQQQPDYIDEFGSTIAAPRAADEAARADAIRTDLARYESMRSFDGPLEGLVALGGQLGGALRSPESFITEVPGVTSLAERLAGGIARRFLGGGAAGVAERTAGAAATQALVQGGVNPAIQGIEMGDGLRKEFSPGEVAGAVAGGALLGGALHGAGEAVGALARRAKPAQAAVDDAAQAGLAQQRASEAQNMAALAQEDPSLRPGGEETRTPPAADRMAEQSNPDQISARPAGEQDQALTTGSDGPAAQASNVVQPEAPAMDGPAVAADPAAAAERAAVDVPREEPAAPIQDGSDVATPPEAGIPAAPEAPPFSASTKASWTDLRPADAADAPAWAPRIQSTFDELARGFGIEPPRLSVGKQRFPDEGPLFGANDRRGNIVLSEAMGEHHALNNAMHEFGHEVQFRLYDSAPQETRDAIQTAFREATQRDYGNTSLNQLRPVTATQKLGEAGQPKRIKVPRTGDEPIPAGSAANYQHAFPEWFAEQVSRWATTDARPVGAVERFFSGVADAWRKIYERIAGHTPLVPEMRAFLDGRWQGSEAGRVVRESPAAERLASAAKNGKPLSLSQYIARNGGLALDGEARARDLNRVFVPGGGPIARAKGHSIDGFWREALIEHGYLPPDADGMAARNVEKELFDALDREQRGERTYSAHDDVPEKTGTDNQTREIEAEASKITKAMKQAGLRAGDVDQRTMMEAAEMLWRGDADDPLAALEHAMMAGEEPAQRVQGQAVDGLQFRRKPGSPLARVSEALDRQPALATERQGLAAVLGRDRPDVQFRNREPAAAGEPGRPQPPEGVAAAATAPESPATEPLRSLQQQAQELADALDVPLRQGRVQGGKDALGQFRNSDEVMRVRNVADFETVAHEAGHALERRVGAPLSDLVDRFARELGPLDYDPQRRDPAEGFAEWMRTAMFNPAAGQRQAPGFEAAFRDLMGREAPDLLASLDRAVSAHQAYLAAPTGEKLEAMVRKPEEETVIRSIRRDGLPATIGLYLSRVYESVFDDKAPVARAVRSMTRAIYAATGERIRLEGAENPENLTRLFARANQAAVQDMREGVRPYRGVAPEGPSLHDALAAATGKPGPLGRWDEAGVEAFDRYLVARRSDVLYRKFEAGEMERRPIALSAEEVRSGVAEMEAANPTFRAASDMVHQFTRQLLRKQYDGGLIDADLFGRLMAEDFYVPMFRHMDERPEGLGGGSGGADGPGTVQTVKRMRGSDRDVIPPTQSLMTQAFLVNRTLQHNDIIKSFVALARQAREAGAHGVGRVLEEIPPTQMMGKRFDLAEAVQSAARAAGTSGDDLAVLNGALTDVFGNDPIMASIFRPEPTGKRGEPLIFYKDGGQLRAVRLQSKDEGLALYESLAGLPPVARDFAMQFGATTSGLMRSGIVTNPTFMVTNFIRDQLAVGVLRSDYVPFVSGGRGIWSELHQDQWAGLYSYAGGVSPGAGSAGLSELIDRDVNALARKGWKAQKLGGIGDLTHGHLLGPLKAVAETVETSEAGTRLAVMKTVFEQKKRQGLSDYDAMIEAAAQSTDLMDFGRHGSGTLYLRTLVPFFNAHLQGLDKARRTLIEPLWRAARDGVVTEQDAALLKNAGLAWTKLAGMGGALGTMYGLWAAGHEAYRDANEELRATHLIIPGDAFGRPGKVLVVPKPFELAMGFNLGEAVGLKLATGDPRAAHFAMDGVREVIQPPNPLTGIPALKTAAELTLNRSFFTGRDIVPENLQNKENPRFEVKPGTSSFAKGVGDALNISPIKVDYAVGSMFGNWGRDLLAVSNQTDPNAPAAAGEDTMFLRRFIKGADRSSETTKLFWEQAAQRNGAFAQASTHYADLLKSYQDRDAADYLAALPASQRAFVMLAQGGDEGGKSSFSSDDRRLHPITRAATAVQTVGGMIKELTNNSQKTFEDGERIAMDPQKRRDVIDALRGLQAIEQRNAMVLTQQKGYEGRPLLSAEDQFAVIKAQSPEAGAELATRYATNKILTTEAVAKAWPEAQKRLLADGTDAEIRDLSIDAKAEGWAFDGDAVRKPKPRRAPIIPGAPLPAREPRIPAGLSVPKDIQAPNPFN